jgi:hypothetical protein
MCEKVGIILMLIYFICIYHVLVASFCYFRYNYFHSSPKCACVCSGFVLICSTL